MKLDEISQGEFESMFGAAAENPTDDKQSSPFSFEPTESLFTSVKKEAPEEKPADKPEDKEENPDEKPEDKDDSLFKGNEKPEEKREFDIKSYFTNRIKEGKFLPLEDEKLESEEDYDALIEANFEHKINTIREDLDKDWYESKSNAWKFIAQNAEKFDDPKDLLPFIQGVQTIEKVSKLNPEEVADAEKIVRFALTKKGESEELIDTQITSFKDANTLVGIAKQYQPLLVKEENKRMAQITYEKEQQELRDLQMLENVHNKTVEILETPLFGKHKLKREEKSALYELIAEPNEDYGYGIFKSIDDLYAKGDFDTIREIGLILLNKESHRNYLGVTMSDKIAEGLLRKVKTSTSSSSASPLDDSPTPTPTTKLKPTVKNGSGFGFFQK